MANEIGSKMLRTSKKLNFNKSKVGVPNNNTPTPNND